MITKRTLEHLRVKPGSTLRLARRTTASRLGLSGKREGARLLARQTAAIDELQYRLWAEQKRSVLLVLQGMDTAGKDGAIRHVFTGVNPQAIQVTAFGRPSEAELARDYLWRVHQAVPRRGTLGIFNRSHYEDLVTVRVLKLVSAAQVGIRYGHVREFERMLADEGTTLIKIFLHISPDEQRQRLLARARDSAKNWKFNPDDLATRKQWDVTMNAYQQAMEQTSTTWAPWYVVPADHKWVRNVAVSALVLGALRRLDPKPPAPIPGIAEIEIA